MQRYETWADETEKQDWPLDIIGFDSYPSGTSWRFVQSATPLNGTGVGLAEAGQY